MPHSPKVLLWIREALVQKSIAPMEGIFPGRMVHHPHLLSPTTGCIALVRMGCIVLVVLGCIALVVLGCVALVVLGYVGHV